MEAEVETADEETPSPPQPPTPTNSDSKTGGWVTSPFIIGSLVSLGIGINGLYANLVVYLIDRYNMGGIEATQISNIINGCTNLLPILGAIVSDSFFGCFPSLKN
ncbi:putative nitrate excretion transporter 4 [Acorus gramineus]|uniref:Nitrate excretion transporter 4 n=1 Tax=Acorus gramineus TaxID=55184 RepID=A0AAV9BJW4_ACOGR|nr:putative nitrate excretion transporter 4 [Acorus gramineus]